MSMPPTIMLMNVRIDSMMMLLPKSDPRASLNRVVCVLEPTIHDSTRKKSASEAPSLKRLSHSKSITSLFGTPSLWNIERTVTGSVELMIVPNNKAIKNGISYQKSPAPKRMRNPMTTDEIMGEIIARSPIGRIFRMISLYGIVWAI